MGLLLLYQEACWNGFEYNAYKIGIVGDGSVGGIKVKMKDGWYPLWVENIYGKNKPSTYPAISYGFYQGCEDNVIIHFYKLPNNYFIERELDVSEFQYKEYPWGSVVIKEFMTPNKSIRKLVLLPDMFFLIEVSDLEYLDEIERK